MKFCWQIALMLICLGVWSTGAWAADEEVDPGQATFRENYSTDQNELIDPYTGDLKLVYTDLKLPGDAGLDLVINRTYNSSRPRHLEYTLLGIGWDIHFGRLRIDKPKVTIELQDGTTNQAIKETMDVGPDLTFIYKTKDFWKVDTQGTPKLYLPDGTRITFGRGGTSDYNDWHYATEIWKNGKSIKIFYVNTGGPERSIDYVIDSVGRRIDFVYTTFSDSTTNIARLTSITCPEQPGLTVNYGYPLDGTVTRTTIDQVVLPEGSGSWEYSYDAFTDGAKTFRFLQTITTPFQGVITYSFNKFFRLQSTQYGVAAKTVAEIPPKSPPRLATGTWRYKYGTEYEGRWTQDPVEEDYTEITDPCGRITVFHFYGNTDTYTNTDTNTHYCYKYGMIKRQFVEDGSGNIEYAVFNTWDKLVDPISPYGYGVNVRDLTCSDNKTYVPVLAKQEVYRGGSIRYSDASQWYVLDKENVYTTEYASYDDYGNPGSIKETGENFINPVNNTVLWRRQRNTTKTYWYNTALNIVKDKPDHIQISGDSAFPGTFTIDRVYDDTTGDLLADTQFGVTTRYTYLAGNIVTMTDPNGNVTRYTWENGAVKTIDNAIYTIDRVINRDGTIESETNGRGFTTTYVYYNDMKLREIHPPIANPTTITYVYDPVDDPNAPYKRETRGGFSTWTYLDGLGREVKTADSLGITSSTAYNACGLKSSTDSSIGDKTDFDYLGRVKRITHKDQNPTTYISSTWVDDTHVVITDEKNYTTDQYFNAFGNPEEKYLTSVVDAENRTATYSYNILGSLTRASREGITHSYTYNPNNNFLTQETGPEGGTVTYTRRNDGTILTKTDALGVKTYGYDGLNRLRTIKSGVLTQGFAYDSADNLTSVTSPDGTVVIGYDAINRPVTRQTTTQGRAGDLLFGYDDNDNVESISYPSGSTVSYTYNHLNQAVRVHGFGGEVNNISYYTSADGSRAGLLKGYTFLNGQATTLTYNLRRMLTGSSAVIGGSAGALDVDFQYTDPRGNMTAFINNLDTTKNKAFGYDPLNRLTTFNSPSSWGTGTYAYFPSGNRSKKSVGAAATTYSYASNRLTGESGGRTFGYNLNGDMKSVTEDGVTYTYEYDWFHNMTKYLKNGAEVARYGYDGTGLRLFKDTSTGTIIYHNGLDGNVLSEMNDQGRGLADYVYLNGKLIARVGDPSRVAIAPWLHLLLKKAN